MKTRNQLIDIAKGLSMVLIVLCHCDVFYDILSQFHVPIFAFLSGYVFNVRKYCLSGKEGIKKCCVNKFRTLYVPFIVFNSIYIVLHNQFIEWNFLISSRGEVQYSLQDIAYRFVQTLTMGSIESLLPLWFLPCLMISILIYTMMLYITLKIVKNRFRIVMLTATFVLSVIGYIVPLPRNADLSFILLFWFSVGVYVREKDILACIQSTIESNKMREKLVIIFLASVSCMVIAFSANYRVNWFDEKFFLPLAYLSILGGIYLVILGSYAISKCKVACRVFSKIGRHTVMILALHVTVFRLVDAIQVAVYDYPPEMRGMGKLYHNGIWIIMYPVAGIIIPLAISRFAKLLKRTSEGNKD